MNKFKKTILLVPIVLLTIIIYSSAFASEVTGGLSNQGVIPVPPSGVTAWKTGDYEITIIWNAVTGVDGYKVYRKKDSADFQLIADNVTALLYKDSGLVVGVYSYQIQSFKGTLSPDITNIPPTTPITIVAPVPPTPPPAPSGGGGGPALPPSPPTPLSPEAQKADINDDNKIDILDFNSLMVNWGSSSASNPTDFNGDSKVDIFDFNYMMIYWTA